MIDAFSSLLRISLSIIFIHYWGVIGFLTGQIITEMIVNIIGLLIVKRLYNIVPDIYHTGKTILTAIISGGITIIVQNILSFYHPIINLVITVFAFLATYLIAAPMTGAIETMDINNINLITENFPRIKPLVNIILSFEEKIINTRTRF